MRRNWKSYPLLILWIFSAMAGPAAAQPSQPKQLVITGAVPNLDDGIVTIVGSNFGIDEPSVTLDGAPMVVQTYADTEIVAALPPTAAGSYLLVVSKGNGTSKTDDFELAIGVIQTGVVPSTVTVSVLCPGQTIGAALATPAVKLTVEFTGTCVEDVVIERDRATLQGVGAATIDGTLTVQGATNVVLRDFSLINGRGVRVISGSSADIARVSATDTSSIGFVAGFSSNAILTDVTAANNSFAGIASINNSHLRLLGTVAVSQSSNTGIFVGGSSELDSRATSLTLSDNAFAGVAVQSGGSIFMSSLTSSNNVMGVNLVNGGVAAINGGTVNGNTYGVYIDSGSTAEIRALTVDGGGVTVTGNSMLRADGMVVTGNPDPDFGVGMVVQSSHLLIFGGSIDNSLFLAEGSDGNFVTAPVITPGLTCHSSALAYGALSCPP